MCSEEDKKGKESYLLVVHSHAVRSGKEKKGKESYLFLTYPTAFCDSVTSIYRNVFFVSLINRTAPGG